MFKRKRGKKRVSWCISSMCVTDDRSSTFFQVYYPFAFILLQSFHLYLDPFVCFFSFSPFYLFLSNFISIRHILGGKNLRAQVLESDSPDSFSDSTSSWPWDLTKPSYASVSMALKWSQKEYLPYVVALRKESKTLYALPNT